MKERILTALRDKKRMALAALFVLMCVAFFPLQRLPLERTVIHTAWDDAIPFLPVFVIPYCMWFGYIAVNALYLCFFERESFFRLCRVLLPGVGLCLILFVVLPTAIDFRPDGAGEGFLLAACRWLYANDGPVNVCPSLHCFEAVAIHLCAFRRSGLRKHRVLRLLSGVLVVLICLSTVFIKQHSVVDLICGVGLAVALFLGVGILEKTRQKEAA